MQKVTGADPTDRRLHGFSVQKVDRMENHRRGGRPASEGMNLEAARLKGRDHVSSDKTGRTGEENAPRA